MFWKPPALLLLPVMESLLSGKEDATMLLAMLVVQKLERKKAWSTGTAKNNTGYVDIEIIRVDSKNEEPFLYSLVLSAFACCGVSFLRIASVALWTVATSSSAREFTTYSDSDDLIDSSWKRRFSFSRSANSIEYSSEICARHLIQ